MRFHNLEKFELEIHEDIEKQNKIAEMITEFDKHVEQEEQIIRNLKELRRYMLGTMLSSPDR